MISKRHLRYTAVLVIALGFLLLTWSSVNAGDNGGNALNFGGASHVVITEGLSIDSLGTGSFTLEAWAYARPRTGVLSIIRDIHDYSLYVDNEGNLVAMVFPLGDRASDDGFIRTISTVSLSDDQWHHVAAVWNEPTMQLYVDGNPVASTVESGGFGLTFPMWIGNDAAAPTQGFDGYIDEVRIWNTARTTADVRSTMFQTVTVTTPNLVGYWPFNEGSGQSTADVTGNGNDGTLGSDPAAADSEDPTWTASTAPLGSLDAAYQNDIAAMWVSQSNTVIDSFASGLDIADVSFLNATGDDIIFGNNGAEFHSGITTNLSPTLNAKKRWARLWQLDVNDVGTTGGNVDLIFDISEAGGTGSFSVTGNYYLLRRPTNSAVDFEEATVISSSVTGDRLTFRVAITELGSEFTVGADDASPSAVAMQNLAARSLTDTPDIKLVGLVLTIGLGVVALAYRRRRLRTTP